MPRAELLVDIGASPPQMTEPGTAVPATAQAIVVPFLPILGQKGDQFRIRITTLGGEASFNGKQKISVYRISNVDFTGGGGKQ